MAKPVEGLKYGAILGAAGGLGAGFILNLPIQQTIALAIVLAILGSLILGIIVPAIGLTLIF
ncbi:hypothetical protein [Thermofilum sp.]|uniref:hypothetical protein n=1 Tax=Thermofilum sp. TaxID=1961369 RepID=UPI003173C91A